MLDHVAKLNPNRASALRKLIEIAGTKPITELSGEDITRLRATIAHLKPYSQRAILIQLRVALRALEAHGCPDLYDTIQLPRKPEPRTTVPTGTELILLSGIREAPIRWVVLCASQMGMRFGMCVSVRPIDFREGRVRLLGKMGRTTDVPVSRDVQAMLNSLPRNVDPNQPVIIGLGVNGTHLNSYVHARFTKWKERLGVRKEVRIHDLRRVLARKVWENTKDLLAVQRLLAHRQLDSTLHYLHGYGNPISAETLESSIEQNLKEGTK